MINLRKLLCVLLAVCMVTAILPVEVVAAEAADTLQEEGLITKVPDGMNVTSTNSSWVKAEDIVDHEGKIVYKGEKNSSLRITTGQKCYVVFDYTVICTGEVGIKNYFRYQAVEATNGQIDGSNGVYQPAPDAAGTTDSTVWHTAVVDCTNESYPDALLSVGGRSCSLTAYISDIRIYGESELPEGLKAHVTVEFTPSHGTLSGAICRNGHQGSELVTFSSDMEQKTYDIPIDSVLNSLNFTPVESAHFEQFKITGPKGEETRKQISHSDYYYFTEPGNYTITVESGKPSDAAELAVIGKDGTALEAKGKTDYGDLYVQKTDETEWKIQLTKGGAAYDSVTVTDNGAQVELTEESGVFCYVPDADGDVHEIVITYSQTGCTNITQNVVLWNTLDFKGAFGENNGLVDDFWENAKGVADKLKNTAVDAKNGKSSGNFNFMYDPDPPMGKDEKHQTIFSSRVGPQRTYNSENIFSFSKDGLFSFDYMIVNEKNKDNQYDDSGYACYARKQGSSNEYLFNQTSGIAGWRHAEAVVESGSTVTIYFSDTANVGTWLAISNISFLSDKVQLTVSQEGGGTVSGNGTGEHYKGQTVTLEAVPNAGSAFVGWYDSDGRLITTDSVLPYAVNDNVTLKAKFAEVADNAAQIGENFYTSLEDAFAAAQTMDGNTVVRLLGETYTLPNDFTVPAGETLLLPCSIGDTGYNPVTGFNPDGTTTGRRVGVEGKKYFNLTIPGGVTLTVEGTVLVNAVTGRPSAGHLDMDVNGGWTAIST